MKKILSIAVLSVLLVSCNNNKLAEAEARIQQLEAEARIQQLEAENEEVKDQIQQLENGLKLEQLEIGNTYEGGIIFYIDETGRHGKICSKKDLGKFNWDDAIKKCNAYNRATYTDWYLPSREELNQMYNNLHKNELGGFDSYYYWSSTEDDNLNAWLQDMSDGNQYNQYSNYKNSGRLVRAVRAF